MADTFDPTTKEVTLVLNPIARGAGKKPIYRLAGYAFVSYDGSPDRYLEPRNLCRDVDITGTNAVVLNTAARVERVVGFEIISGRAYETQCFPPDTYDPS